MNGERPTRPVEAQELGLTDFVWEMTIRCWDQDPAERPTMTDAIQSLRRWSVFLSKHRAGIVTCCLQLHGLCCKLVFAPFTYPSEDGCPSWCLNRWNRRNVLETEGGG